MLLFRRYLVAAIFVGSVVGLMFLLNEIGIPLGLSSPIGFLITISIWWFITRKLKRYRIVQIVFLVDEHSVLRDE